MLEGGGCLELPLAEALGPASLGNGTKLQGPFPNLTEKTEPIVLPLEGKLEERRVLKGLPQELPERPPRVGGGP